MTNKKIERKFFVGERVVIYFKPLSKGDGKKPVETPFEVINMGIIKNFHRNGVDLEDIQYTIEINHIGEEVLNYHMGEADYKIRVRSDNEKVKQEDIERGHGIFGIERLNEKELKEDFERVLEEELGLVKKLLQESRDLTQKAGTLTTIR